MNEQLWKYQNNGGIHMQITDVRVRKVTKEGKMKAVVSITIDNEFVVHDIKAVRQQTASTGISHIQLIPIPVNGFRERSLRNTRKLHWKQNRNNRWKPELLCVVRICTE